jgi:hypothetical protein
MVSIYLLYPQGGRISKFHDGETSKDCAILDPDSKERLRFLLTRNVDNYVFEWGSGVAHVEKVAASGAVVRAGGS